MMSWLDSCPSLEGIWPNHVFEGHVDSSDGLTALTAPQTNSFGQTVGPFMVGVPPSPVGWTPYSAGYTVNPDGSFALVTSGEGTVLRVP